MRNKLLALRAGPLGTMVPAPVTGHRLGRMSHRRRLVGSRCRHIHATDEHADAEADGSRSRHHGPGMPFHLLADVERLTDSLGRLANGILDRRHGILKGMLHASDRFRGSGHGILYSLPHLFHGFRRLGDGIGHLMLQQFQFVRERRAGVLHLVLDQIRFFIHCTFSLSA